MTDTSAPLPLVVTGLTKTYQAGADNALPVLRGVDLTLQPARMVALLGPSGSGKSTFLHCVGLLDKPDAGSIKIGGQEAADMDEGARTLLRRSSIGFVYQFHHLLPEFTALENVMMPLLIAGEDAAKAADKSTKLLEKLHLGGRLNNRPARLSGGEQQRVAIARALIHRPKILLADEPTGNLDLETAEGVFSLLTAAVRGMGVAALIATHNLELAARMDATVSMKDGVLHG